MIEPHNHCWHAMDGSTADEHFYACCWGGCNDVMAAGPREFEDKSHGLIGWTPGRVHRPPPATRGVSAYHSIVADLQRLDDIRAAENRARSIAGLPPWPSEGL